MAFGDFKTEAGLVSLNEYLSDKSYIEGFQPSSADTCVFKAISSAPNSKYAHALRWYNHINSYGSEIDSFSGDKKDIASLGIGAGDEKPVKQEKPADDDLDLFGSDEEEDAEAEKLKQERLKQYEAKKAKKPGTIAKSNVVLDVKPWDDETDMAEMEKLVRTIELDGLKWGAARLMPLAYSINKLQICSVVEDEKVSIDWLQEEIQKFEDHVQSVDIAAFQKI